MREYFLIVRSEWRSIHRIFANIHQCLEEREKKREVNEQKRMMKDDRIQEMWRERER